MTRVMPPKGLCLKELLVKIYKKRIILMRWSLRIEIRFLILISLTMRTIKVITNSSNNIIYPIYSQVKFLMPRKGSCLALQAAAIKMDGTNIVNIITMIDSNSNIIIISIFIMAIAI